MLQCIKDKEYLVKGQSSFYKKCEQIPWIQPKNIKIKIGYYREMDTNLIDMCEPNRK